MSFSSDTAKPSVSVGQVTLGGPEWSLINSSLGCFAQKFGFHDFWSHLYHFHLSSTIHWFCPPCVSLSTLLTSLPPPSPGILPRLLHAPWDEPPYCQYPLRWPSCLFCLRHWWHLLKTHIHSAHSSAESSSVVFHYLFGRSPYHVLWSPQRSALANLTPLPFTLPELQFPEKPMIPPAPWRLHMLFQWAEHHFHLPVPVFPVDFRLSVASSWPGACIFLQGHCGTKSHSSVYPQWSQKGAAKLSTFLHHRDPSDWPMRGA